MSDVTKEPWIVIEGSIYTKWEHTVAKELSSGKLKTRKAIAFNVGRAAEHIVRIHNASLGDQE